MRRCGTHVRSAAARSILDSTYDDALKVA